LGLTNTEVEVEYQTTTIGTYGLEFDGKAFILTNTQTDCLAKDACGVPQEQQKITVVESTQDSSCDPASGCC
jgi:hypothetical protein